MPGTDVSGGDGGVLKEITKPGTGPAVQAGQTVFAHYTGKLADGRVFDSTIGKPHRAEHGFYFQIGAGQVIKGWDVGFASMRVGESAVLTIAPEYGYGDAGIAGQIPRKATLIFEVELLDARVISDRELAQLDAKVAALRR